ncbi:MAG: BrnT family toxin [Caldilineales bacterium]|nr:BrnT family toxin [Caldilineales bacterium]
MDERRILQGIVFAWHTDKAHSNRRKHGIDLATACEAFFDPFLVVLDNEIVDDELRGALLGLTKAWRLLYVVYALRNDTFRLISARPATSAERRMYENQ